MSRSRELGELFLVTGFWSANVGSANVGSVGGLKEVALGEKTFSRAENLELRLREIGLNEGETIRVLRRAGGMVYVELGVSSFALRQCEFEKLVLAPLLAAEVADEG